MTAIFVQLHTVTNFKRTFFCGSWLSDWHCMHEHLQSQFLHSNFYWLHSSLWFVCWK